VTKKIKVENGKKRKKERKERKKEFLESYTPALTVSQWRI